MLEVSNNYFKGKKITVMGLGLLGRGVGDALYLAEQGADLIVTDLKTEELLRESVEQLQQFPNVRLELGGHRTQDFQGRDMILKSASVPLDSMYIAQARKEGTSIEMSASLAARLSGAKTIGVTGTRGKSTVTYLLAFILARAGKDVVMGGNVRGVANLPLLDVLTPETHFVMELDSWQLQGFGEVSMSPHVAVFTTFMPDHMHYYNNNEAAYLADKAHIFLHQTKDDHCIIGRQAAAKVMEFYREQFLAPVTIADESSIPSDWTVSMPGVHNRYNAGCAYLAARALGIDDEIIRTALAEFSGVEGRLQKVGEKRGVTIYNDNNATTPEATIAGLKALDNAHRNIILICGGVSKGLLMDDLVREICARVKAVVLLSESGTKEIEEPLHACKEIDSSVMPDLSGCVDRAFEIARPGDTILFSPAFASFGKHFKNEYDRNDKFLELVKNK